MGVQHLPTIIKRYAPRAVTYTTIKHYVGKKIGIDANLLIYKMIYAVRLGGSDIENGGRIITHIHVLLSKLMAFVKYKITPIFVFDGAPPLIKSGTLDKRKEFQSKMQAKYMNAINPNEKKKYYFMKADISPEEITDCMDLISCFGYTIVESIEEADSQLADLVSRGIVDYVATDDTDILIFGGKNILKNFSVDPTKTIEQISLAKFRTDTGLTQAQLVDLAILLGCDYCSTIKGIGPVSAYKLIQTYGSLESVHKSEGLDLPPNYKSVRKYFLRPLIMDHRVIRVSKLNVNRIRLENLLTEFAYEKKFVRGIMKKLIA